MVKRTRARHSPCLGRHKVLWGWRWRFEVVHSAGEGEGPPFWDGKGGGEGASKDRKSCWAARVPKFRKQVFNLRLGVLAPKVSFACYLWELLWTLTIRDSVKECPTNVRCKVPSNRFWMPIWTPAVSPAEPEQSWPLAWTVAVASSWCPASVPTLCNLFPSQQREWTLKMHSGGSRRRDQILGLAVLLGTRLRTRPCPGPSLNWPHILSRQLLPTTLPSLLPSLPFLPSCCSLNTPNLLPPQGLYKHFVGFLK